MIDSHYFQLPYQGNTYSMTPLHLPNGNNKLLVASLKREIFCFEYPESSTNVLTPSTKEVLFTYIPGGAEIISIDAFNKSKTQHDFVIGITILKTDSRETFLNVYSGEESPVFHLDSIAQNCLMLELNFIPYQLYHTDLPVWNAMGHTSETVWLLSGSDENIHFYRENKINHGYKEFDIKDFFPELLNLPSIVIWMDIAYFDGMTKRLTAYGCECGFVKLSVYDVIKSKITESWSMRFENIVTSVRLFTILPTLHYQQPKGCFDKNIKGEMVNFNLLVVNTSVCSTVFMDVLKNGLTKLVNLSGSNNYNVTSCSLIADIDLDGRNEILLGTYGQEVLVYKYVSPNHWNLSTQRSFANPVFSMEHFDLTGDGMKELSVLTMRGVNILQNDPKSAEELLYERFKSLSMGIIKNC